METQEKANRPCTFSDRTSLLFVLMIVTQLALASQVCGQGALGDVDVTGRSSEEQLPIPERGPAPPPKLELPLPKPPAQEPVVGQVKAFIREIRIEGNTVFTKEQLASVTTPYLNRELTSEDIEALRTALTVFYVNHGYINSGALIPDQTITNGILTVRIVEGRLTRTEVEGNTLFLASYFRDRLEPPSGAPLNVYRLQERLQILQQDERIKVINAEIRPGTEPGEAVLDTKVKEENRFPRVNSSSPDTSAVSAGCK